MSNKLFVGGLSFNSTEESLRQAFSQFGTVVSAKIIIDRETNRSKGFGFVEMSTDEEAQNVIKNMDGQELDGRRIKVNEALPQDPNRSFKPRSNSY